MEDRYSDELDKILMQSGIKVILAEKYFTIKSIRFCYFKTIDFNRVTHRRFRIERIHFGTDKYGLKMLDIVPLFEASLFSNAKRKRRV